MWLFRKKTKLVVTKRSEDSVPFEIPKIDDSPKRHSYKKNKFVSPIFGTKAKDEVVIPTPYTRSGDLDRQLDTFRTKRKLSKEEYKKRYGSEYPEFDTVSGSNLNEAMKQRSNRQKQKEEPSPSKSEYDTFMEEEFEQGELEETEERTMPGKKTKITDFFDEDEEIDNNETQESNHEEKEEQITEKKLEKKPVKKRSSANYKVPNLSLLATPKKQERDDEEWIQQQIEVLNRTFSEFNVGARVHTFTKGPTVTRYEIVLDSGVNVKKITALSDNVKMALAAKEIRIEAPIPGKSTVGIEVPNEIAEIVHFKNIIRKSEFQEATEPLTIALGLNIDGEGVYTSISKMPHGLVAGATGSGKSVCINTILMSLLFQYSPKELRLMLIDPKMVELSSYNEIPHLITPVITDAKIATAGLKWAVDEMEQRFVTFSNSMSRDIHSYNKKAETEESLEYMPYIVIIVDELNDLMVVSSSSVEEAIMRITQKARAAGIHLIIATQRPSTDVIKGTIKSNIPTRIAFSVSSYVDSMTIIDESGAEKLLGRGDMLFAESGQPKVRVQGAYISDEDIQNVNQFLRRQEDVDYMFTQDKLVEQVTNAENKDELFDDIARFVVVQDNASINRISKEFNIGFNRAQKNVEDMADLGIVSDNLGPKAREVLITLEELEDILKGK